MQGFKSAILPKVKNCQNGTFEPLHEIQNNFGLKAFFKHYESVIDQKFPENVPGFANSMIKVSQSTKREFSKKALSGFEKLFLFWDRMIPSNAWEGILEVASSFSI
jgi:hypothetical protein